MLILSSIIFLFIGGVTYIKSDGWYDDSFTTIISILTAGIGVVATITLVVFLFTYPYNIDEKIAMYEEENIKIEEKVRNSVKGYMDFENDTLKNLIDTSDLQTLLIKYPELNSNELVKMEIETYKENSQKIKELKEKSITRHRKAWWIYFGK